MDHGPSTKCACLWALLVNIFGWPFKVSHLKVISVWFFFYFYIVDWQLLKEGYVKVSQSSRSPPVYENNHKFLVKSKWWFRCLSLEAIIATKSYLSQLSMHFCNFDSFMWTTQSTVLHTIINFQIPGCSLFCQYGIAIIAKNSQQYRQTDVL